MDRNLVRAYLTELVGTFVLVFFGAGVVCVNHLTEPTRAGPGAALLHGQQPGLVGIALAQGLALAVALAATLPISGGCLNPAITLTLWVFNRMNSVRAAWLIGAQVVGATLAGFCLSRTFDADVLHAARLGAPHLSPGAYPAVGTAGVLGGTALELALTFFLAFAIFGPVLEKAAGRAGGPRMDAEGRAHGVEVRLTGLAAGLALTAGALVVYPLTGAAANPARWFGTAFAELILLEPQPGGPGPLADTFVYVAGPTLGALLAGLLYYRVMAPAELAPPSAGGPPAKAADLPRPAPGRSKR